MPPNAKADGAGAAAAGKPNADVQERRQAAAVPNESGEAAGALAGEGSKDLASGKVVVAAKGVASVAAAAGRPLSRAGLGSAHVTSSPGCLLWRAVQAALPWCHGLTRVTVGTFPHLRSVRGAPCPQIKAKAHHN